MGKGGVMKIIDQLTDEDWNSFEAKISGLCAIFIIGLLILTSLYSYVPTIPSIAAYIITLTTLFTIHTIDVYTTDIKPLALLGSYIHHRRRG